MNYLSVCSGIEAVTCAWHDLNFTPVAFSEIEDFPSSVLKHHYPDVPNLGDMSLYREWPEELLASVDLLVGGTPCQAFSLAGNRNSLADERGNLTLIYENLLEHIDEARRRHGRPPAICLWENVPGVLNTDDNAFGCFLGALAGEDGPLAPPGERWADAGYVRGPSRTIAWRCLDAQYFGVAQRRNRVFLVASAREGFHPEQILFEFKGMRRDSPPSREAGEGITHDVAPCIGASGRGFERTGDTRGQDAVVAVRNEIPAIFRMVAFGEYDDDGSASTLKRRDYKDATDLVAYSGANLAENELQGTLGFYHTNRQPECGVYDEISPSIKIGSGGTSGIPPAVAQAFKSSHFTRGKDGAPNEIAFPICAESDKGDQDQLVLAHAIAFETRFAQNGRGAPDVVVPPLKAQSGSTGKGDAAPCVAFAQNTRDELREMAVVGALSAHPGTKQTSYIRQKMQVRRLTPTECERLQGFPDGYTLISSQFFKKLGIEPDPNNPKHWVADGPRYKALGNSMAVVVMKWIGFKILTYENKQ